MLQERTEAYAAGVDVCKEHLELCVRRGLADAKEGEHTFGVSLLDRLLEEHPALVIGEATGGFQRPVAAALAALLGCRSRL